MTATGIHARTRDRVLLESVDLVLRPRVPLGIVGESGAGKTTLLRLLSGWPSEDLVAAGELRFPEGDCFRLPLSPSLKTRVRRYNRLLPQTFDCLCPIVTLRGHIRQMRPNMGISFSDLLALCLERMRSIWPDFSADLFLRYPGEFSGGEIRRLALMLMLIPNFGTVLVDEPTTGIDHIRRADIIAILMDVSSSRALGYTTHDLGLVRQLGGDIILLKEGKVIERGPSDAFLANPQTPYGQSLVACWQELIGQ